MGFLRFFNSGNFSIVFLLRLISLLESIVIFLLSLNFYLYFYFLRGFSDFYYFSLFFLHVPVSWISLLNYLFLLFLAFFYLLFVNLEVFLFSQAFLFAGILFTWLTIFTGMFWGLPLWGLLFALDARFLTVLVLLVFYLFYVLFFYLATVNKVSYRFIAYLIIFGSINIPLIKYSVDFWNTLHQASSITQVYGTVHYSVYIPLLLFFFMLLVIYGLVVSLLFYNYYLELRLRFFKAAS